LVLAAKQYNNDGSLFSPASETTSLYGDIIHVNGQPWPFLKVEPRRYRFRFLNAAISRSFFLYFEQATKAGTKLDFWVIGSDAGLLDDAQKVKDLYISMAERWEVVFDFSNFKGQNITLRNTKDFAPDDDFLHTDKVMRFVVGTSTTGTDDSRDIAQAPHLRTVPYPPDKAGVDHHFKFERQGGEWKINGVSFADVANRILARPARGLVEVWELENSSGGWSHPIHIHLIDFKIVKRTGGRGVMPYEAHGLKDVVWLGPGETVTVEAYYAPWSGVYMFHCHNLIHEDHEMMAAFNVSVLTDLGYRETNYVDPMDPLWRAKPEGSVGYDFDAVQEKVAYMSNFEPYNHVDEVEGVLAEYYSTKGSGGRPAPTSSKATTTKSTSTTKTTTTKVTTTKSGNSGKGGGDDKDDDDKGKKTKRALRFRPRQTALPFP
jgi:bilirubin oxidase